MGRKILFNFENEATAISPSVIPVPGREILSDFDEEVTGTVRAANGAFISQDSDPTNQVLGGLTRRKGGGLSGRRRKLVKVKQLRPNEINEVEVSSKQWKRGKLRRKALRPTNTKIKHDVRDGEGLRKVNRTQVLRRRGPSNIQLIDNDQKNIVRIGNSKENSIRVAMSEERESDKVSLSGQEEEEERVRSGKFELVESLREDLGEKEGRKVVKGRGRVVIPEKRKNGKVRNVTMGEGRKITRGEGSNVIRGDGRVRKVVKRKKVGGRKFGGRRYDSGEKEKVEEEKGEEGMVVTTGLRRKVRRKMRRRERVENSSRRKGEARHEPSSGRVNTFSYKNLEEASLKNLATEAQFKTWSPKTSTTPVSSPTTGIQKVCIFTTFPFAFPFSHPQLLYISTLCLQQFREAIM